MTQDSSTFWKKSRVELRAAGFDPDRGAQTNAVVTIASAYTNAHRCNNRVRSISDLLVELLAEHGGQGLIVGAPAVSDALTQGTPTAGYSLVSRDVVADCFDGADGRAPRARIECVAHQQRVIAGHLSERRDVARHHRHAELQ